MKTITLPSPGSAININLRLAFENYPDAVLGITTPQLEAIVRQGLELLPEAARLIEPVLDEELGRWQNAIRDTVIERTGCPPEIVDGSGCDSGDPLDLTLTEIGLAINWLIDEHAGEHAEPQSSPDLAPTAAVPGRITIPPLSLEKARDGVLGITTPQLAAIIRQGLPLLSDDERREICAEVYAGSLASIEAHALRQCVLRTLGSGVSTEEEILLARVAVAALDRLTGRPAAKPEASPTKAAILRELARGLGSEDWEELALAARTRTKLAAAGLTVEERSESQPGPELEECILEILERRQADTWDEPQAAGVCLHGDCEEIAAEIVAAIGVPRPTLEGEVTSEPETALEALEASEAEALWFAIQQCRTISGGTIRQRACERAAAALRRLSGTSEPEGDAGRFRDGLTDGQREAAHGGRPEGFEAGDSDVRDLARQRDRDQADNRRRFERLEESVGLARWETGMRWARPIALLSWAADMGGAQKSQDRRLVKLEHARDAHERRLADVETKVRRAEQWRAKEVDPQREIDRHLLGAHDRLNAAEDRLAALEHRVGEIGSAVLPAGKPAPLKDHEARIVTLERRVGGHEQRLVEAEGRLEVAAERLKTHAADASALGKMLEFESTAFSKRLAALESLPSAGKAEATDAGTKPWDEKYRDMDWRGSGRQRAGHGATS